MYYDLMRQVRQLTVVVWCRLVAAVSLHSHCKKIRNEKSKTAALAPVPVVTRLTYWEVEARVQLVTRYWFCLSIVQVSSMVGYWTRLDATMCYVTQIGRS